MKSCRVIWICGCWLTYCSCLPSSSALRCSMRTRPAKSNISRVSCTGWSTLLDDMILDDYSPSLSLTRCLSMFTGEKHLTIAE